MEGHRRVDHHDIDAAGGEKLEGPFAVGGQDAVVAGTDQGRPSGEERVGLVVDDEDPGHGRPGRYPPTTATPPPSVMRPTS
ncbi:MAG TPA: hypothetical protein VJ456_08065 [Acidimicrobiia bacterium]|nr:hypothetical protein [Acidimicrobiia bacterium]